MGFGLKLLHKLRRQDSGAVFVEAAIVMAPLLIAVFVGVELGYIEKNRFVMADAYKTVSAQSSLGVMETSYLTECENYISTEGKSVSDVTCEVTDTNGDVKTLLITVDYDCLTPLSGASGISLKMKGAFYGS